MEVQFLNQYKINVGAYDVRIISKAKPGLVMCLWFGVGVLHQGYGLDFGGIKIINLNQRPRPTTFALQSNVCQVSQSNNRN